MLYNIFLGIHIIAAVFLIIIVLIQTGKGSEVGFAFGAGAAQTMFGSSGGKSFIMKFTVTVAIIFMVTSISLALMQAKKGGYTGVLNTVKQEQQHPVSGTSNQSPPAEVPIK